MGSFWSVMQNAVSWSYDILNGFIKSVFFAIAVVWIALFNGYDYIPTSEGISRAHNQNSCPRITCGSWPDFIFNCHYVWGRPIGVFYATNNSNMILGRAIFTTRYRRVSVLGLRVANAKVLVKQNLHSDCNFDNIGGLKVRHHFKLGG